MLKCLITGGAGFIGSHLVEALVRQGHSVTVFDNLSTGKLENLSDFSSSIDFVKGDIQNPTELLDSFKDIDIVFHLAALSSVNESVKNPALCYENNVTGTMNVFEAARKQKVEKIILASSAAVYGSNPTLPKTEEMPAEPINPYGLSKYIGELYGKQYSSLFNLQVVCLRFFNVYGPRQNPNSQYSGVISNFANKILSGENPIIYGDGYQSRDFIYVKDIVNANLLAMNQAQESFSVYNVATGVGKNLFMLLEALKQITQKDFEIDFMPERRKDIRNSLGDIAKIKKALSFAPQTSFSDGLRELINFINKTHS